MESLTEPAPRLPPGEFEPYCLVGAEIILPVPQAAASLPFEDVLAQRRSCTGGPLALERLAALLWHAARVRERHSSGRFGLSWDQRAGPSAGGLHVIQLMCLPLEDGGQAGVYDPLGHMLVDSGVGACGRSTNRQLIRTLTGATSGTAIWFASNDRKAEACYENSRSLVLRDSGALAATLGLCAAWLGIAACTLGALGEGMPTAFGFPEKHFTAVGGILVGEPGGE